LYPSLAATLRAQAAKIEADIDLFRLTQARELELSFAKSTSDLEIEKAKRLADIEIEEFQEHVTAIGPKTIQAIATSGPDNQVR
jgi:major vault protein